MSMGIVSAAVVAVGAGYKMYKGAKQDSLAKKVVVPDATRTANPAIPMAQQMFNSRMPGLGNAEQNIMTNQANGVGSVERNASSGSQAISLISALQGQSNDAYGGLAQQEANYKINTFNNLASLQTHENDQQYADQMRKRQEAINEKGALRGAAAQNISSGINDIGSALYLYNSMNTGGSGSSGSTAYKMPRMDANPQKLPYK